MEVGLSLHGSCRFRNAFCPVYFLIKKLVVDNIERINGALGEITGGNLNVSVNVRTNEEFASLSDDINSTVVTLKGYIKEAAARIDKELEFAKEIQLSALPSALDGKDRFALKAKMRTAKEVGGDFYDYFPIDDNRLALVIADVSGKGIPAALFMMKSLASNSELTPGMILEKANAELALGNDAEMFVTVWLGIYDFSKQLLVTANAGHEFPALAKKGEKFAYLKDKHGFVLAGMVVFYSTQQKDRPDQKLETLTVLVLFVCIFLGVLLQLLLHLRFLIWSTAVMALVIYYMSRVLPTPISPSVSLTKAMSLI